MTIMSFLLPEPPGDVLCALARGRVVQKILNRPTGNRSFISVVEQIPSFLWALCFLNCKNERDNL